MIRPLDRTSADPLFGPETNVMVLLSIEPLAEVSLETTLMVTALSSVVVATSFLASGG